MLITTCTQCLARFRVTPQQLNARQGKVRCGRCGKVFSGFEALERFPDDDTGARLLAAREAAGLAAPPLEDLQSLPGDTLDDLESLEPPPAAAPVAALREMPAREMPVREAVAAPAAAPPAPPLRRIVFDEDLLEPPPRKPLSRAWSFGVVLLALVLSTELAFAFRASLAQRYPVLRPWLDSACAPVGCTIAWSHDDRLLKLEDSELLEVPGKPDEIALAARIRNLATAAQEYPYLELTLTDLGGQPATRRVLRPTDYLGRPLKPGEALAPGAEIALQLRLQIPRIRATGYELLLFYP